MSYYWVFLAEKTKGKKQTLSITDVEKKVASSDHLNSHHMIIQHQRAFA